MPATATAKTMDHDFWLGIMSFLPCHDILYISKALGNFEYFINHEAVGVDQDSEMESGYVTVTLQKGYMSGDRVLRPAMVRVAE